MIPLHGFKPIARKRSQSGWEFLSPSTGQWMPFTEDNQSQIFEAKAAERPTVALSNNVFIDLRRMILRNITTETETGVRLRLPEQGSILASGLESLDLGVQEPDQRKGGGIQELEPVQRGPNPGTKQWIIPDMAKKDLGKAKYSSQAALPLRHQQAIPPARGRFAALWEKEQADSDAKVDQLLREAAQSMEENRPRFHVSSDSSRAVERAVRSLGELSNGEKRRLLEADHHTLHAVLKNCGLLLAHDEEEHALAPACFLSWLCAQGRGLQLVTEEPSVLEPITKGLVVLLQTPASCNRLRYAVMALHRIQETSRGVAALTTVRRALRRPGRRL